MEQINKVELLGIVGSVHVYNQGPSTPFARVSLVTKSVYFQASTSGDVVESTWHNVIINQGRNMPDLSIIKKGDALHLIGRIRNNKYTSSEGQERYSSDIIVQSYEILNETPSVQL